MICGLQEVSSLRGILIEKSSEPLYAQSKIILSVLGLYFVLISSLFRLYLVYVLSLFCAYFVFIWSLFCPYLVLTWSLFCLYFCVFERV